MEKAKKGNKYIEMLLIVALNAVMFGIISLALKSDYVVSLITLLVIIIGLLILEKKGVIDWMFRLYLKHKVVAFVSAIILAIATPFILQSNRYALHIAILACIYSINALGLNFQMGSTDMTNFASAAFFGIGAYTTAVFTVKLGLSPWLGLIGAGFVTLVFGFIVGAPTLRTKGYYLSLVTMALQLIFTMTLANIKPLGGPNGIIGLPAYNLFGWNFGKPLELFGMTFPYQMNYLFFVMVLLVIFIYVAMRVNISRTGLAFNNIAQDEVAAKCFGINITKTKLLAFCMGAVFCGIAGAVYGHYMMLVVPDDFDFNKSLIFICMVILGGMDNPVGVVVGALILSIINEKLRDFADYQMLFYGIILMTVLIVRPAGLIPKRVRNYCDCYKLDIKKREEDQLPVTSPASE